MENFKPNESVGSQEGTDDVMYDLIATINHQPTSKNQGRYTMIVDSMIQASGTNMMMRE